MKDEILEALDHNGKVVVLLKKGAVKRLQLTVSQADPLTHAFTICCNNSADISRISERSAGRLLDSVVGNIESFS